MITLIVVALALISMPLTVEVARRRERNPARWAIAALVFGLLAFVVVLVMPGPRCEHCRRRVKPRSTACGHCGRDRVPQVVARGWSKDPDAA